MIRDESTFQYRGAEIYRASQGKRNYLAGFFSFCVVLPVFFVFSVFSLLLFVLYALVLSCMSIFSGVSRLNSSLTNAPMARESVEYKVKSYEIKTLYKTKKEALPLIPRMQHRESEAPCVTDC